MVKQYVGARYVPKFASPVEWASNTSYEALTIVTFNNASYTSKIPVPPTVGNPANNPNYWALTGNYNAQVEEYIAEVQEYEASLTKQYDNIEALSNATNTNLNDYVYVKGYYTPYDNGGSIYHIVENKTTDYDIETNNLYATPIYNIFITPEQFGCYGNGTDDDSTNMQNCINFAENNNLSIICNSKSTYRLNTAINIKTAYIDFNNCKITNYTGSYAITINYNDTNNKTLGRYCTLKNLIIDCNNYNGIYISGIQEYITNIRLLNLGGIGFNYVYGYENTITHIFIQGIGDNSAGLVLYSGDCYLENWEGINVKTVVRFNTQNKIRKFHFWIGDINLYNGSIFADILSGQPYFEDIDIDTYQIAFRTYRAPAIYVKNSIAQYNPSFVPDSATTYLVYCENFENAWLPYLNRVQFVNSSMTTPSKGTYNITNITNNKLAPFKCVNSRMNSRLNDYVDITEFCDNIIGGTVLVKYWDNIYIDVEARAGKDITINKDSVITYLTQIPIIGRVLLGASTNSSWAAQSSLLIGVNTNAQNHQIILAPNVTVTTDHYHVNGMIPLSAGN